MSIRLETCYPREQKGRNLWQNTGGFYFIGLHNRLDMQLASMGLTELRTRECTATRPRCTLEVRCPVCFHCMAFPRKYTVYRYD
ncbi:hypothetical protein Y032_0107g3790 [Ancylostoma ceylanicum]|uniref:Uncharacterized protein n=1 Tax=Ancylostoma ceylanicum TaxID=53326 RepID=A0A016TFE8_9BILA|nr:hypothetical protein Y032_0107g3790 [Ancylostoma ceylanicum]